MLSFKFLLLCNLDPLFLLLISLDTDLLLLSIPFLLSVVDEILTIKLFILKIFLGFIMLSLTANKRGLKVLLFALLMNQLISKSFVSHPDFVDLSLIKLIQSQSLRWKGSDWACLRARAHAPPWAAVQLIVPTHGLLRGQSTATSESVLAIWLSQLVHSQHGDVCSGPWNLTVVELSVTLLLLYSLPLLNNIIKSLLKRRQVVVVSYLGQLSYQLVVLIFLRLLVSHLSFEILQTLPWDILHVYL